MDSVNEVDPTTEEYSKQQYPEITTGFILVSTFDPDTGACMIQIDRRNVGAEFMYDAIRSAEVSLRMALVEGHLKAAGIDQSVIDAVLPAINASLKVEDPWGQGSSRSGADAINELLKKLGAQDEQVIPS